ncbi:MAG: dihydroneopterin aldolase [Rhodospirillaceae bacterium]|nr:dihydroneopterin aldolase [Rhodospirillaceae bacterium]
MARQKNDETKPAPRRAPDTEQVPGELTVFIRDMVLECRIGIHQHERIADQRVRINLEATVRPGTEIGDDLDNVVCYGELVTGIRHVIGSGHTNLAETLAERIATMCFEHRQVHAVRVRVEKLDVFPEAESVGVEIERRRP